jgi:hypothetical protein
VAWKIKADMMDSCSCAVICPCTLGPAKPDQEWCSVLFALNVTEGSSDGVDLSGAKVFIHFELAGDFVSGIDKAKLYIDPSASDEQRSEIDAIFHGEKGGLWGGVKETIKEWLPSSVHKIEFTDGGTPGATVEGVGQVTLQLISAEDGTPTTLAGAPVLAAFGIASTHIGNATGTGLNDADMRSWESLGHGSKTQVEWAG